MTYRGCKIIKHAKGYVWDELTYGAESDSAFPTIEECKADIRRFFGAGPAPREINGEVYA